MCQKYKGTMFRLNIPHFFTLAVRRVQPLQRDISSAHAQTSSKAIFQTILMNIDYSGRSEFLFLWRCLIFHQFLRVWLNSVDSLFCTSSEISCFEPKM